LVYKYDCSKALSALRIRGPAWVAEKKTPLLKFPIRTEKLTIRPALMRPGLSLPA